MTQIKKPGTPSFLDVFSAGTTENARIPQRRKRKRPRTSTPVWMGATLLLCGSVALVFIGASFSTRASHHSNAEIERLKCFFPVHISDEDFEEIDHPGFQMADRTRLSIILGDTKVPQTIMVPRFWDPPAFTGVREFLGNSGRDLITKEEAGAIGSFHEGRETIFVSLASYRDPECTFTVESLFQRAKYPHRIRVAIVDQRGDENDSICNRPIVPCDQDPDQALCRYQHLIDYREYPAQLMVGPTFARHLAHRMYRGEYFVMQVDSHVRFVEHWDADIISQWEATKSEMAVLTTYMSDIVNSIDPITHRSLRDRRAIMCNALFDSVGDATEHIRFSVQPNNKPKIQSSPMLEPFFAAGFSFSRAHFLLQVPYDPHLPFVFQGEEISMTVRGFTYGYDFYAPSRNVVFHIYATREKRESRVKVKLFTENETIFPGTKEEGYRRLNGIIRLKKESGYGYYRENENIYGLGSVRAPETFYSIFGIHRDQSEMEQRLCDFVQGVGGHKSMHDEFTPFLRYDGMGIDYGKIHYEYHERRLTDSTTDTAELASLRESLRESLRKGVGGHS